MKEVYKANTITGMLTSLHWVLDIELSFQSDSSVTNCRVALKNLHLA